MLREWKSRRYLRQILSLRDVRIGLVPSRVHGGEVRVLDQGLVTEYDLPYSLRRPERSGNIPAVL